jgi:RNA polymerase sigma factor (sigma-70 family)
MADRYKGRLRIRHSLIDLHGAAHLGLARALSDYNPTKGPFRTWAYGRVRGALLDELRRVQRVTRKYGKFELTNVIEDDFSGLHTNGEIFDAVDNRDQVRTWLARLSPGERRVVELYYYHNQTFFQIGKKIELTKQRVFQLLAEAMGKLRGWAERDERR